MGRGRGPKSQSHAPHRDTHLLLRHVGDLVDLRESCRLADDDARADTASDRVDCRTSGSCGRGQIGFGDDRLRVDPPSGQSLVDDRLGAVHVVGLAGRVRRDADLGQDVVEQITLVLADLDLFLQVGHGLGSAIVLRLDVAGVVRDDSPADQLVLTLRDVRLDGVEGGLEPGRRGCAAGTERRRLAIEHCGDELGGVRLQGLECQRLLLGGQLLVVGDPLDEVIELVRCASAGLVDAISDSLSGGGLGGLEVELGHDFAPSWAGVVWVVLWYVVVILFVYCSYPTQEPDRVPLCRCGAQEVKANL